MTLPLAAAVNELATRIEAQAGELERQRAELAALQPSCDCRWRPITPRPPTRHGSPGSA